MHNITEINSNIHRLEIPYKDIYTSIYTIKTDDGVVIIDTADCERDIKEYIVPFLKQLNYDSAMLKYIFITHHHRDHSGGLKWLLAEYPNLTIISRSSELKNTFADYKVIQLEDSEVLLNVLKVISIPGHTLDSAGIMDTRTKTLITGDSLQLYGIFGSDDWAAAVCYAPEYFEAIEKVRNLDVENIYMAHDYHPVGYKACGKDVVENVLDLCIEPLRKIKDMICNNPQLSDAEVRETYNSIGKIPTVSERVVSFMRKYIEEGRI